MKSEIWNLPVTVLVVDFSVGVTDCVVLSDVVIVVDGTAVDDCVVDTCVVDDCFVGVCVVDGVVVVSGSGLSRFSEK